MEGGNAVPQTEGESSEQRGEGHEALQDQQNMSSLHSRMNEKWNLNFLIP